VVVYFCNPSHLKGRRTMSLRTTWATQWDPVLKEILSLVENSISKNIFSEKWPFYLIHSTLKKYLFWFLAELLQMYMDGITCIL
jgi:hypothetical protein